MRPMVFEHFCGKDVCGAEDEVRSVLGKTKDGKNEFIIHTDSDSDSEFPYISVLVKEDYAYIWYTHSENLAGYQAYGEDLGLDPNGDTIFYINTATEEMYIPNRYVNTKERVLQAVLEFMSFEKWPTSYEELPKCARWEEL